MFLLLVEMRARSAMASELENLLTALLEAARDEPGTLIYAVHRQQEDAQAFVLYELYRDRAAWEVHCATEAVQQALRQFENLLIAPPRLVFCNTLGMAGYVADD
nr:antibiotic biosynthesis monooxygenase [Dechloromonas sp.]